MKVSFCSACHARSTKDSSVETFWWSLECVFTFPIQQAMSKQQNQPLHAFHVVMCEYSKFRIESNGYLLFDSIWNWRNYSKYLNTYLTVISRAIDTRFVCTLPATSLCTHLTLNPVLRRVCSYPSHSPDHARTHAVTCMHAPSARSRPGHLIAL